MLINANNKRKVLVVLCGLPGCGKSEVIKELHKSKAEFVVLDAKKFIRKYSDSEGKIHKIGYGPIAYREFFTAVPKDQDKLILELGTNWPQLIVDKIKELSKNFKIYFFLCLLDRQECLQRLKQRGTAQSLIKRFTNDHLKRDFPRSHIIRLEHYKIPYFKLDMTRKPIDNARTIERIIAS